MADYHCPQCKTAIRGTSAFKIRRTSKSQGLPGNLFHCPQCHTLLAVLTNWWAIGGISIALLAVTTLMLIDKNAYKTLSLGLVVLQVAGFLLGIIAIWYLQRYSLAERTAPSVSQLDAGALKAKKTLLGLFASWIVLDMLLVAFAGTVSDVARVILTLLLMYFVVQGKRWARTTTIGLFGLCVVGCVAFGVWKFQEMRTVALIAIAFSALISVIPLYLLLSRDLHRYFAWKQNSGTTR